MSVRILRQNPIPALDQRKSLWDPLLGKVLIVPVEKSVALPRAVPSPARAGLANKARMGVRKIVQRSRELRKNLAFAERKLRQHMRDKQIENFRFRRQRPIGKYILDFICLEAKLVIELDGGQHAEQQKYDDARTSFLESEGLLVLRFWNNEVIENIEGVLERVRMILLERARLETPSQPLTNGNPCGTPR